MPQLKSRLQRCPPTLLFYTHFSVSSNISCKNEPRRNYRRNTVTAYNPAQRTLLVPTRHYCWQSLQLPKLASDSSELLFKYLYHIIRKHSIIEGTRILHFLTFFLPIFSRLFNVKIIHCAMQQLQL